MCHNHVQEESNIGPVGTTTVKICGKFHDVIPNTCRGRCSRHRRLLMLRIKAEINTVTMTENTDSTMGLISILSVNGLEPYHSSQAQPLLVNIHWFYHLYKKYRSMALLSTNPRQNAFGFSLQKAVSMSRPLRICSPFSIRKSLGSAIAHIHVQSEARPIASAIRFATDGCQTP